MKEQVYSIADMTSAASSRTFIMPFQGKVRNVTGLCSFEDTDVNNYLSLAFVRSGAATYAACATQNTSTTQAVEFNFTENGSVGHPSYVMSNINVVTGDVSFTPLDTALSGQVPCVTLEKDDVITLTSPTSNITITKLRLVLEESETLGHSARARA